MKEFVWERTIMVVTVAVEAWGTLSLYLKVVLWSGTARLLLR